MLGFVTLLQGQDLTITSSNSRFLHCLWVGEHLSLPTLQLCHRAGQPAGGNCWEGAWHCRNGPPLQGGRDEHGALFCDEQTDAAGVPQARWIKQKHAQCLLALLTESRAETDINHFLAQTGRLLCTRRSLNAGSKHLHCQNHNGMLHFRPSHFFVKLIILAPSPYLALESAYQWLRAKTKGKKEKGKK